MLRSVCPSIRSSSICSLENPQLPAPARELAQAETAILTVTDYVAPSSGRDDGRLRGTIEYMGDESIREWMPDGHSVLRQTGTRVRIHATLDVTWAHRLLYLEWNVGSRQSREGTPLPASAVPAEIGKTP